MRSWELVQFPLLFLCIERSDYEDKVEIFAGHAIEVVIDKEGEILRADIVG